MNRFLIIMCLLSSATAVAVKTKAEIPLAVGSVSTTDDYPRYAFNYAVHDPLTKDNKAQWEMRDGDVVKGTYSLIEPDGTLRIVDYIADDRTGFNAVVKELGPNLHVPAAAKLVTPPAPVLITGQHLNYGFGGAPVVTEIPKDVSLGRWSLPWDPFTHSFGGWFPINSPLLPTPLLPSTPYATIFSRSYTNRKLHNFAKGPIPLYGNTLVFK